MSLRNQSRSKPIADEFKKLNRALRVISACNRALQRCPDEKALLQQVCQAVVRLGRYRLCWVGLARQDTGKTVEPVAQAGFESGYLSQIQITWGKDKRGRGPTGTAIRTGRAAVCQNVMRDSRFAPWRTDALKRGYASTVALPMMAQDRALGALMIYSREPDAFGPRETNLLQQAANDLAQGIIMGQAEARRRRAEEQLRRNEAYLAAGQRLSHTGSWAWNVARQENSFWSEEHYHIYGFEASTGTVPYREAWQRIHPQDKPLFDATLAAAIRNRTDFDLIHRLLFPDGSIKYIHTLGHPVLDSSGHMVEYIGTAMDVTERKLAEEALRQTQSELARVARVTTVGELTASIAHEVNQPLAAVVTNGNACLRWLAAKPSNLEEARKAVERIIRDANRASEVIARIRMLLKKNEPVRTRLNPNQLIREIVALVEAEARRQDVSVQTELAVNLPRVTGDRVQLQQVLLNLVVNALDAMSTVDQGRRILRLQTSRIRNEAVQIAVQDSGVGLTAENPEQFFEAFYTTKPQGLGMGLSISRSIVESHGGRLWAAANDGPGASFLFTLPVRAGGTA